MAGHEDVDLRPFFPQKADGTFNAATVNIVLSASSQQVALSVPKNQGDPEIPSTVRVVSIGTVGGFIEFGVDSSITAAAATGIPILPNSDKTFLLPKGITNVAAIGAAGSTIYFTPGHGT